MITPNLFQLKIYPPPCLQYEVSKVIKSLKTKSSPGLDGLSNSSSKIVNRCHLFLLTSLFNKYLSIGYFLTSWKHGCVVIIPKPNKPSDSTDGYRPITLLPALSKVFEKLILSRILIHLDNFPFHKNQYGFCEKFSPQKCINDVLSHIYCEQNKNLFITAISFIMGAFDHAW